ncbi:bifunctional diguanylate cyclase/phosphodiesterase [Micromonospora sp. WMMD964]|uniref:bifunctional diguanylate cyclase/phosphodiesterase n=1 Tax=Micromonospora sp. WMMD964 TaxID=3016091 RepID=UPI00249AB3A9|nr:bifunctional diguanylate cyclase/phosphodiesterase [Micromonospora sp. WMMD964]WFF03275.1 bifunctional diguanylate cyclase/phosphodiesterase [Micromonospora sp. WMMD964]
MEVADPRNSLPPGRATPFATFVVGILVVAALTAAVPLAKLPADVPGLPVAFWTMAVLAVVCDARPFVPPGRRQTSAVFPSTCFTFAILLGWGLAPAVAVQAVGVIVSGWRMRHAAWRTAFNVGQYACALAAAYGVIQLGSGIIFSGGRLHWTDVAAVGGATLAWFVVNYGLVSWAVRLRFGDRWWPTLRRGLGFELLSTGSLLLLAPVLVAAARVSAALIPLVLVPLFAVYRMARLTVEQQHLAAADPLTGLPNRKALLAEVAEQVHLHAERTARGEPDGRLALLLIDLDRFKNVNDALGHAVGDRLLVEVSARLTDVQPRPQMIARLGGDEFAIVMTGLTDVAQARELADRVVQALAEPVPLDGLPLDVGGSIGIAIFPEHGEDFATLMRHADVAMYDAKHRNDTVAVYAPESDHNSAERLGLLADLRRVLESGPSTDGLFDADQAADPADQTIGSSEADAARTSGSFDPGRAGSVHDEGAAGQADGDGRKVVPSGVERVDVPLAGKAEVRGGDGAALPIGSPAEPAPHAEPASAVATASPAGLRWWGRRRRNDSELAHADELIKRIATGADPIRGRGSRASVAGTRSGPARERRAAVANGRRSSNGGALPARGNGGPWPRREGGPGTSGHQVGATGWAHPDGDAADDAGEITMYYQPQIAIATGEVVGVEALLRWRHPRRGMVDPEELIRVAEQSAVMRLLTRRVVDDVVEQLAKWSAAGIDVRAALNVSVRDLHTGEIADQIADRLARHQVPAERLQVEITEGALMADPRRVLATISHLHRIGVAISLDDFGTGYSSLQHLRRLPLSEVKVDRSFVLGMADDADDAAIVRSMIELAGALGLRVVAEGVEDERTWRMLHAAGCDAAQGWFYARPMPAEELVTWLARYRPVRPSGPPQSNTGRHPTR